MTDYTDVPAVNALHMESQQVAQAIANLEAGGFLGSMMISPAPPLPPEPGQPIAPMMMSVMVYVPPPTSPALVAEIIQWLEERLVDLATQMSSLGVTVPPPAQMLSSSVTSGLPMPQPPILSTSPMPGEPVV
jgi:hypothetical protein